MKEGNLKYSLEVYEDHALIKGWLDSNMLTLLVKVCKKHGFTHLAQNGDGGFKLVKKGAENE